MPSPKPKPIQTPFKEEKQQQNTYGTQSIAGTPEAKALLDVPLDIQTDYDIDPGVGRRTALAEQEAQNRANSAFGGGVPQFFREQSLAREKRGIRAQGAYEAQQAEYGRKQLEGDARNRKIALELERRRILLPSIVQTGGSSSGSGYNTQITQQQSPWSSIIGGAAQVGAAAIPFI